MDVESSRGIESMSSHDISNGNSFKVHLRYDRDETKSYSIGTRSESPPLTETNNAFEKDWLDERLVFDLVWCMTADHCNDEETELPLFGSWTVFNSMVTEKHTLQSDLD